MRFTDRWSRYPIEELAMELMRIHRFLQVHLLSYDREKGRGNHDDDPVFVMYHAEVPELMLEVVKFSFDPEFALGGQNPSFLCYLAIEILTDFVYKDMPSFTYLSDKLFRDLSPELTDLLVILRDESRWIESLAIIRSVPTAATG